jgi:Ham1 family protein
VGPGLHLSCLLTGAPPFVCKPTRPSVYNQAQLRQPEHLRHHKKKKGISSDLINMPAVVNFITGNANKLGEVKAILEPAITVRSQAVDIEEVQGSVEEVTLAKCRKAAETVSFLPPLVYS